MKVLPVIIVVFLLIFTQTIYVHALELPTELVAKLHTNLRIAFLYGSGWSTIYEWPLPIKYYQIVKIDTDGLYGIDAYDVLVMQEIGSGELTTEQINIIVKFVEGGGGLIVSSNELSETLKTLLSKLGITIKAISGGGEVIVIPKDGKIMIDHPVTAGVEKIEAGVYRTATAVEIDNGKIFIKSPFVAVAKSHGNGRVIYIGGAVIYEKLSGIRLGVNAVEWVAGYTPPEWSPPDTSIIGSLREENAKLKGFSAGYEELKAKYDSLKVDYEKLKADLKNLEANYNSLKDKYNALDSDYKKLASDYQDLKSKYEATIKMPSQTQIMYPELVYLFLTTTIILTFTTIYFAWKKKK
jgi:NACalpha-BTF3-like transcription factor/outer membrane murein-binding lipoprotein Lpp